MANYLEPLISSLDLPPPNSPGTYVLLTEAVVNDPGVEIPNTDTWVSVRSDMETIFWSLDFPEAYAGMSSASLQSQRRVPDEFRYKLRHDFVSGVFGNESTDVPLSDIFQIKNDGFDNLTPDFIIPFEELNLILVIEIRTIKSFNFAHMVSAFREKQFKYEQPLINRLDSRHIIYLPIVVSDRRVIAPIELPRALVIDLILRMKIGLSVENQAKAGGFPLVSVDDEEGRFGLLAKQISDHLETIELEQQINQAKIMISPSFIDSLHLEPNNALVSKLFMESIRKVGWKEAPMTSIDIERVTREFVATIKANNHSRLEPKSIINMPLISPAPSRDTMRPVLPGIYNGPSDCPEELQTIWKHVNTQLSGSQWKEEDKARLKEEALMDPTEAIELARQRRPARNKYHRVTLKGVIDARVQRYLAKDGIGAKKMKEEEWLKTRVAEKKLPFSWDVSTRDIEEFIDRRDLFEDSPNLIDASEARVLELLEMTRKASKSNHVTSDQVLKWMSTNWYRALNMMTDIATELAAALKQNVDKDEFILKKLRHSEVYILIKPTNSQSHVFYSIMTSKNVDVLSGLPFRKVFSMGQSYVTEFTSVRADKLGNFLNAGPRFLSLIAHWSDFYGLSFLEPDTCKSNIEWIRMINLSILVSLENKSETEETCTITRYMYMEIFKGNLSLKPPRPFKMLPKLRTCIRSRLNMYLTHKVIGNFSRMLLDPPARVIPQPVNEEAAGVDEDSNEVPPQDEWNYLLNCYTGGSISTATQAVDLMYLGYFKDKNETAQGNVEWGLVEKIVEEELKVTNPRDRGYYGEVSSLDELSGKKFSKDCVIAGTNLLIAQLRRTYLDGWKTVLHNEICEKLAHQLTHEIASLKASANLHHATATIHSMPSDTKPKGRVKVVEALASRVKTTGLNPFTNYKYWLEYVETSSKGVMCDLFKKNQHGGLREIYVLTIESRILQLFIETIARTICSHFPDETLTHPENKLATLDRHKSTAAKRAKRDNRYYTSMCNSSDKTRWNQNLIMTCLGIPLFKMTNPSMHGAIQRTLNLWANKLVRMPASVIQLLQSNTMLTSSSYKELKRQWNTAPGVPHPLFRDVKQNYVNLTTGMMQGILHYSSSLLHLAYLELWKQKCLQFLGTSCTGPKLTTATSEKVEPGRYTWLMSSVCSSDDSATILSTFFPKISCPKSDLLVAYMSALSLHSGEFFCRTFGMMESVKSTIALPDYVEFNSEFIFRNTVCNPKIKFTAASLVIAQSESYVQRMFELYNLISALNSSGMPSVNCSLVQWAQGIMHYKSLGSHSAALFDDYCELIKQYPDITHGFFLLDPDILAGVCGLSFSRYLMIQEHPVLLLSLKHFNKTEAETAPDGSIVDSLNLKHGDNRRWYTLLDRVAEGQLTVRQPTLRFDKETLTWIVNSSSHKLRLEQINSTPYVLYNDPRTVEELTTKLLCSVVSPSVGRSLSKGNPLVESFSSTPYCLFSHCYSRTTISKDITNLEENKVVKTTGRISLLRSLNERVIECTTMEQEMDTMGILRRCFVLKERYDEVLDVLNEFRVSRPIPHTRLAQKKSTLMFCPALQDVPLSFYDIACSRWYQKELRVSNTSRNRMIDHYRTIYHWFADTPEESLELSPFDTHVEMHGFINGLSPRTRSFRRTGPAVRARRLTLQILSLIRRCSFTNALLYGYDEGDIAQADSDIPIAPGPSQPSRAVRRDLNSTGIDMSLLIPLPDVREQKVMEGLRTLTRPGDTLSNFQHLSVREYFLGCLSLYSQGRISGPEIATSIERKSAGCQIYFTQPQRRFVEEDGTISWKGEGTAIVRAEGIRMRIHMSDRTLLQIRTNTYETLRSSPAVLKELCRILDLTSFSDQRADGTRGPMTRGAPCAVWTGTQFGHGRSAGAPIYKQEEPIGQGELENLRISVTNGQIALMSATHDREYPVLRYRPDYKKIPGTLNPGITRDVWEAWITMNSAEVRSSLEFLTAWNEYEEGSVEKKTLTPWIRSTLKKRLAFNHILVDVAISDDTVLPDEPPPETDEDIEEELARLENMEIEGYMEGRTIMDSFAAQLEEHFGIEGRQNAVALEPVVVEEPDVVGNWGDHVDEFEARMREVEEAQNVLMLHEVADLPQEMLDIMRSIFAGLRPGDQEVEVIIEDKRGLSLGYIHPLWDDLIKHLIRQGGNEWFVQVFNGTVPVANPDFARLLMKIYGITETTALLGIDELLRQGRM